MKANQPKVNKKSTKTLKKSTKNIDSIMLKIYLGQYTTQPDIASKLHTSKQNIHRILQYLLKNNFITQTKTYPRKYKTTAKGSTRSQQLLEPSQRSQQTLRLHNTLLVAKILQQPKTWNLKHNTIYQVSDKATMKNWKTQYQGYYLNNHFLITPSSICMRTQEIYALSPEEAIFKAVDFLNEFLDILMEENPRLRIRIREGSIQISSLEIALEGDGFARKVVDRNETIITKRFIIDSSKKIPEIEFIHKDHAMDDTREYQEFIQKIIDHKIQPEELTTDNIGRITRLLERFGEKIEESTVKSKTPNIGRVIYKLAEEMYIRKQKGEAAHPS